jgi:hypothetical protein
MLSLLGLLGGALFAWAAVPASIATVRAGKSIGVPVGLAWAITLGTVLMFAYLTLRNGLDWVLVVNYGVEFVSWAVILRYHYLPRCARTESAGPL